VAEQAAPIRLTGIRGLIAHKVHESLSKTAQMSFFTDVDATALIAQRAAYKTQGVKIGYEDLVVRAVSDTLADFPMMNAVETVEGLVIYADHNIACAIALPGALVAPAIFNCEALSVEQIAEKRQDLIARAKLNKLSIAELTSGTLSISNLGQTRTDHFTPILNYPQVAIFALGRIVPRAWVASDGKTIEARPIMGLSLTVDHRFIDGAPAADFLTAVAERLERAG
jgi:pyruvate/2-oxoglutarate dehydrogenase complex dihydrolipoamide acyltransferase (E2) component